MYKILNVAGVGVYLFVFGGVLVSYAELMKAQFVVTLKYLKFTQHCENTITKKELYYIVFRNPVQILKVKCCVNTKPVNHSENIYFKIIGIITRLTIKYVVYTLVIDVQ